VHLPSIMPIQPALSGRSCGAAHQHKNGTTYGCFLPDLTGFMGVPCGGPRRQHSAKPMPEPA